MGFSKNAFFGILRIVSNTLVCKATLCFTIATYGTGYDSTVLSQQTVGSCR